MKADSGSRRHAEAVPLQPDAARTAMTNGTACGRPSRTTRIDAKIHLDAELSEEQKQGILQAADCCHITDSIKEGMQIACSLVDAEADNVQE